MPSEMSSSISEELKASALLYHRQPRPGKLEVLPTKPLGNQRDLALAYTPGVASACEAIAADPAQAAELTSRQNLVAVVSNGTAVLGLGNIGPLASKPVMEGKAVLFKKFAGIDVFDIEIAAHEVDRVVEVVAAAVRNALDLAGKRIEDVKIVTSGAGAAALACLNLLVSLGARRENIWITDRFGVAWKGRA